MEAKRSGRADHVSWRRLRAAGIASILAAAIASAPARARAQFVTQLGGQFRVNNQPFKFVGFGVRGITHYGKGDVLPFSHTGDRTTNLDYVQSVGGKVIRSFIAYGGIGQVETGNRLQAVLDAAWARGIRVICVLTDFYGGTQLYPQGDAVYYSPSGGYILLNHTFFQSGYQAHYLPQAVYLANRFRDHPGVFAWELGNEIRDLSSGATFVSFCLDVAGAIRAVDSNHLVGAGLISWKNANLSYSQAVQIFTSLDYLTSHNYNGSDFEDERQVASAVNKPFFIEEAGFAEGDRPAQTDADIAKWVARGASGYMHWGLMASSNDNGDGDRVFGIDRVFHANDWDAYITVYANWAAAITPTIPHLDRSPASIIANARQRHDADAQSISVTNVGGGTSSYSITENAAWVSVAPGTGTSAGNTNVHTVSFSTASLPPGDYTAMITITDATADNSPQTIAVSLTITPSPADFDGDGDVDVTDYNFFQLCFNGPGRPMPLPECTFADLDQDGDADVADFTTFQACFNGANNPPACE